MENENEQIQEVEEDLELPEVAEGEDDTTDWKALALKQQGINKRLKTKIEKISSKKEEKPDVPAKPESKPNEFKLSSGDKALLNSYKGIKGADEIALCENWLTKYGGTPEDMIEDDVFNSKLEKLREAKLEERAIPRKTGRSSTSDTSAIDYYLEKPFSEVPKDKRIEVLNARLEREKQKQMFG